MPSAFGSGISRAAMEMTSVQKAMRSRRRTSRILRPRATLLAFVQMFAAIARQVGVLAYAAAPATPATSDILRLGRGCG